MSSHDGVYTLFPTEEKMVKTLQIRSKIFGAVVKSVGRKVAEEFQHVQYELVALTFFAYDVHGNRVHLGSEFGPLYDLDRDFGWRKRRELVSNGLVDLSLVEAVRSEVTTRKTRRESALILRRSVHLEGSDGLPTSVVQSEPAEEGSKPIQCAVHRSFRGCTPSTYLPIIVFHACFFLMDDGYSALLNLHTIAPIRLV